MKKIFFIGIIGLALYGLSSCEKLDDLDKYKSQDIGQTSTLPLNGEYFVHLDTYNSVTSKWERYPYVPGYVKIMVSNTARNTGDSVWVDDFANWPMKIRVKVDPAQKLFVKSENEVCKTVFTTTVKKADAPDTLLYQALYPVNCSVYKMASGDFYFSGQEKISLLSGSVMLGVKTPAGNESDSIMVEFEGSSDPGVRYRYAGYRRTGFLEDEQ